MQAKLSRTCGTEKEAGHTLRMMESGLYMVGLHTVSRDVTCWGARVRSKDVRVVRHEGGKRLGWDPRPGGWGSPWELPASPLCGTIFCIVFKGLETTKQVGSCMI